MHLIPREEVNAMLDFPIVLRALEQGHMRPPMEVAESILGPQQACYFVRHAVDTGRYMASKLITSFPGNPATTGLPAVQAVVVLFDGADGRPLAIVDGTAITHWRTAGDSALGAKYLARPESEELLVVGAGEMSRWLARAFCSAVPSIRRVRIWNRTPDRAMAVVQELAALGLAADCVTGPLDQAVGTADIVSCCTRSHDPVVLGKWLRPGTHLDLVGGFTPAMREVDDEAIRRARIFVDLRRSADLVGDISRPLATGVIAREDVLGELSDLVQGKVAGRQSETEITLYKNAGGGHLDLMLAALIHELHSGKQ